MRRGLKSIWFASFAIAVVAIAGLVVRDRVVGFAGGRVPAVYVHMNAANSFLEPVVSIRPGQRVIFVNEDTGPHTVIGFNARTGREPAYGINGNVAGTAGPGHPVSTYAVTLHTPGIYQYYCSVHARLVKTLGESVQVGPRKGIHGFGGVMAGTIVVTKDPSLLRGNPPSTSRKVLPKFFGG